MNTCPNHWSLLLRLGWLSEFPQAAAQNREAVRHQPGGMEELP